ncbi:MAG TPA: hypothetical protein VER77_05150, partial [Candidatus Dormibacteraeota bacterium]|nr:hypothetical protein [Candidatus Dormibacteraeota bacterium]
MRFQAARRARSTIGRAARTASAWSTRPGALVLAVAALLSLGESARAQVEATPPPPRNPITSRLGPTSEERDRFELGVAVPDGYFDVLGTFAYRRFIHESGQFDQSMQIELTGMKKDYLIEGSLSLYFFLRPLITFRPEWRVRPLLELGPGAHLVVQAADLTGLGETSYRARSYLK